MAAPAFAQALTAPRAVQPQYYRTPFMAAYWEAFMGERGAENRLRMEQNLRRHDPETLGLMLRDIHKNIADLERAKADIIARWQQGEMARQTAMVRATGSVRAQQIAAASGERAAYISAIGSLVRTGLEQETRRMQLYELSDAGRAAVAGGIQAADAAREGAGLGTVEAVDATLSALGAATAAEKQDPFRSKTAAYQLWQDAMGKGDLASAAAVALVARGMAPGEAKRILADEAEVAKLTGEDLTLAPPEAEVGLKEAIGRVPGPAGQPAGGFTWSTEARTTLGPAVETAVPVGTAAPGTAQVPSTGGPATGGVERALEAARARAAMLQGQWEQALAGRAGASRYEGFRRNYLLEPSWTVPARRQALVDELAAAAARDPRRMEEAVTLLRRYGRRAPAAVRLESTEPGYAGETLGRVEGPGAGFDLYQALSDAWFAPPESRASWYQAILGTVDAMRPGLRVAYEPAADELRTALDLYRKSGDPTALEVGIEAAATLAPGRRGRPQDEALGLPPTPTIEEELAAGTVGEERVRNLSAGIAASRSREQQAIGSLGAQQLSDDDRAALIRAVALEREHQARLGASLRAAVEEVGVPVRTPETITGEQLAKRQFRSEPREAGAVFGRPAVVEAGPGVILEAAGGPTEAELAEIERRMARSRALIEAANGA